MKEKYIIIAVTHNTDWKNSKSGSRDLIATRRSTDDMIHSRIIFDLFSDPAIDDTHITVRVENGVVTLDGSVPERRQMARAEEIASSEAWVVEVRNHLWTSPRYVGRHRHPDMRIVKDSFQ